MTNNFQRLSAKNIWGKIVLYLRENKIVALHVACGDITDVRLEGNNFVISVQDGMISNLLHDGQKELERALNWQGLDLNLVIEVKENIADKATQDIEKLKNIFGNYLEIK